MREKHFFIGKDRHATRITPACAGKTNRSCQEIYDFQDHPRVCGKNKLVRMPLAIRMGSPPRVREKLEERQGNQKLKGITPACAGKTNMVQKGLFGVRDHPRVCGKNAMIRQPKGRFLGSPPRVREKLMRSNLFSLRTGITPACAGKTNILLLILSHY